MKKIAFISVAIALMALCVSAFNSPASSVLPPAQQVSPAEDEDSGLEPTSADYSALVTEGNASDITWTTSLKYPFVIADGKATSSNQGVASSYSWVEASLTLEDNAILSFDFTCSTQAAKIDRFTTNMDRLAISVDGSLWNSFINDATSTFSMELEKGSHVIRIEYSKDAAGNFNNDCATFSNVKLHVLANDFTTLCGGDQSFSFNTVADCPWSCYNGVAKPGNLKLDGASSSQFQFSLNKTTAYSVVFDYEMDTNPEGAQFCVYVDGALEMTDSGKKQGKYVKVLEGGGAHTFTCAYTKADGSTIEGESLKVTNLKCYDHVFEVVERNYTAIAHTPFNASMKFEAGKEYTHSFNTRFRYYEDGDVIIDSLMSLSGNFVQYPIKTKLVDNTITIAKTDVAAKRTNDPYSYGRLLDGTIVSGTSFDVVNGWLWGECDLTMNVDADKNKVVAPTGLGMKDSYLACYYVDVQYAILNKNYDLSLSAESIEIPIFHMGQKQKASVVVTNYGTLAATYAISNQASDKVTLDYDATRTVQALGCRDTLAITVNGVAAGEYSVPVTITDPDGGQFTVTISGKILPEINYGDIVTEGSEYITWTSSEDYPWDVVEGVALSGNKAKAPSSSQLTATFTVPEGSVAMLKGEGSVSIGSDNKLNIIKNGTQLASYTNTFFASSLDYTLNENLVAGDYTFTFDCVKQSNPGTNFRDEATLKNVSLKVMPLKEHSAVIDVQSVDFGESTTGTTATATVTFTNMGSQPLQVIAIEGDEVFDGVVPEATAALFETLPVQLTFCSPTDGQFTCNVTIKTNAGDFVVNCAAKAVNQLFMGEGNGTGFDYPCNNETYFSKDQITQSLYIDPRLELLKGCKITSVTFFLIDYVTTATTWADATMKWEFGPTEAEALWDGSAIVMPEGLTTVYDGEIINFLDKKMVVNFNEPLVWNGGSKLMYRLSISQSTSNNSFVYTKSANTNYEASTRSCNDGSVAHGKIVPTIKIEYQLPGTSGVETLTLNNKQVKSVDYYTINGMRHSAPVDGINIVVTTYEDGTTQSHKIVK